MMTDIQTKKKSKAFLQGQGWEWDVRTKDKKQ